MPVNHDDGWERFAQAVREEMVPKLNGARIVVSLVPEGETDIKFALELGLAIMLEKPIVLVTSPGRVAPKRLIGLADAVIEIENFSDPGAMGALSEKLAAMLDFGRN